MPHMLDVALGIDQITIVPRDPETAYVYWEITAAGVINADVRAPDPQFELRIRVRDDEGEPHLVFQVSIHRWLDGMFVPFGEADTVHEAVIGVSNGGEFIPIATSPVLRAPRNFSCSEDTEFVAVTLGQEGLETVPTTHQNSDVGTFEPYAPEPAKANRVSGSEEE